MKKSKILLPIVGAATLAASVVPAVVSCNPFLKGKKLDIIWDINDISGTTGGLSYLDLSNDRIVEGSDYVTEISWKNRASKRLYAFEFAIYVNEKYVHQNSAANTNGYVVMGHDYNKIKIRIPKENFEDPITHKLVEKPKIQFIITLDQSEVQTYNRLTTWEKDYFPVGDVTCDALRSDTVEIARTGYSEIEIDFNNWDNGNSIPVNDKLYFALYNMEDPNHPVKINITQLAGDVYIGQNYIQGCYLEDGSLVIPRPQSGGWGTVGNLSAINFSLQFAETHKSLQFILAQPNVQLAKYDISMDWGSSEMIATPVLGYTNNEYPAGQDFVTQLYWQGTGTTYRQLYTNYLTVYANGVEVPQNSAEDGTENGYVIMSHGYNSMTIKIPAANFTSKKREIEFYLDLEPCTLNDSLVLDQYSKEYYDVGGTKYNAIHSTGAGTPLVKNTSVEFEVDLNKWNDGKNLPPDILYLGLFKINDDGSKEQIKLTNSTLKRSIYLGYQIELDSDVIDGFVTIRKPARGWGNLGLLSTLTCYMTINKSMACSKAELMIGSVNEK